jgi:hypothetical protein
MTFKWFKCVICKADCRGYGNNAQPVDQGLCCDDCNWIAVMPAKMQALRTYDREALIAKEWD